MANVFKVDVNSFIRACVCVCIKWIKNWHCAVASWDSIDVLDEFNAEQSQTKPNQIKVVQQSLNMNATVIHMLHTQQWRLKKTLIDCARASQRAVNVMRKRGNDAEKSFMWTVNKQLRRQRESTTTSRTLENEMISRKTQKEKKMDYTRE